MRPFRPTAIGLAFALVLCSVVRGQNVEQPRKSPNVWRGNVPSKPSTPSTTNTTPKLGKRVRTPRAAAPKFVPLEVHWRLLKFTSDGLRKEVSIDETFKPQDGLMLAVTAHQNGYLYIVRQSAADRDGQLIFPNRHYNGGRNYVSTNKEFILPSDCTDFTVPCWFNLPPLAGKEIVTIIFSRDEIRELTSFISPSAVAPSVSSRVLSQLLAGSQQRLLKRPGVQSERYTTWVTNTNTENNKEIIETLTLNRAGGGNTADASGAAPRK